MCGAWGEGGRGCSLDKSYISPTCLKGALQKNSLWFTSKSQKFAFSIVIVTEKLSVFH